MRPSPPNAHLGLGKLYRRIGACEQVREHVATATTLYCEMGTTYWLGHAEAGLREPQTSS